MMAEPSLADPRIQAVLAEFRELILVHYPDATFAVTIGDDPPGIYLKAIVDLEDTGEVLDAIMDRLLEVQVDEYLPVYVIPLRPPERVAAMGRADRVGYPATPPVSAVG